MLSAEEPAGQHQVGKGKQCEQLCVVLGQAAIACLAMLEQALDNVKAMLNLGAHAGLRVFQFFLLHDPAGFS